MDNKFMDFMAIIMITGIAVSVIGMMIIGVLHVHMVIQGM